MCIYNVDIFYIYTHTGTHINETFCLNRGIYQFHRSTSLFASFLLANEMFPGT